MTDLDIYNPCKMRAIFDRKDRTIRELQTEVAGLRADVCKHNEIIDAIARLRDLMLEEVSDQVQRDALMAEPLEVLACTEKWIRLAKTHATPVPTDVLEWFYHLELHLTEHDLLHAGKALRSAWPPVRDYFVSLRTTLIQIENRERARARELARTKQLLEDALRIMKQLHQAAKPDDSPDLNAVVPAANFREFVDAHAQLLYRIAHQKGKNGYELATDRDSSAGQH